MTDAVLKNLSDAHTEMPSLRGRKAVITGGTTGIGRAIGVLLASEGVEIFTCGRDERHLADGLARTNEAEEVQRAEDIAVAVQFMLTQPPRAVVNRFSVTQQVPAE